MKCPRCGADTAVADSRPMPDGRAVKRRRECLADAKHRITTYEVEMTKVAAYVPKRPING
jgi:transcriptional repressor NrdR